MNPGSPARFDSVWEQIRISRRGSKWNRRGCEILRSPQVSPAHGFLGLAPRIRGLRMACGLRFRVCGLRFRACGLRFRDWASKRPRSTAVTHRVDSREPPARSVGIWVGLTRGLPAALAWRKAPLICTHTCTFDVYFYRYIYMTMYIYDRCGFQGPRAMSKRSRCEMMDCGGGLEPVDPWSAQINRFRCFEAAGFSFACETLEDDTDQLSCPRS